MKNLKIFTIIFYLIITIYPVFGYGNNYLIVRYGLSNKEISYRNSYITFGLNYSFDRKLFILLRLKKLPDENGYYPSGYFIDSKSGVYERGNYSIQVKDFFEFNRIIFGNYILHFGQGILFAGPYSIYINNPYYDLGRIGSTVRVTKSYSKSSTLDGLVLEYNFDDYTFVPFVSWNKFDCAINKSDYYKYNDNDWDGITNDEDNDDFTGKPSNILDKYSCKYSLEKAINNETVYSSEEYINRRNKLTEYILGLNCYYGNQIIDVGATLIYSRFNRLIDPYYNFDPEGGDKSAFYFRGIEYLAGEVYFRYSKMLDFFINTAYSLYKSKSYYKEFSSKTISAVGLTTGIRKRIKNISIILWTGYLPASLVNPHGVEYPWGRNNFVSFVGGVNIDFNYLYLIQWAEISKELIDIDKPGTNEEVTIFYTYRLIKDISKNIRFEVKQRFGVMDNYYYYDGEKSYKLISRFLIKENLSKSLKLIENFELRFGKTENSNLKVGIGGGGRIKYSKNYNSITGMMFLYVAGNSILTYLYPYEPGLFKWNFFPSALGGKGLVTSILWVKSITDNLMTGFKIRYNLDFECFSKSSLNIYIETELKF